MSRALRVPALLAVAVAALALGGCRGGAAAAPPPVTVEAPPPVTVEAPAPAADPLGSVESSLDAIERQVDRDGTG